MTLYTQDLRVKVLLGLVGLFGCWLHSQFSMCLMVYVSRQLQLPVSCNKFVNDLNPLVFLHCTLTIPKQLVTTFKLAGFLMLH